MLRTLGITDSWIYPEGELTVPSGLLDFGARLAQTGYALWHLDTGADEYAAFAVKRDDLDEALRLAKTAGATVETGDMFRATELGRA